MKIKPFLVASALLAGSLQALEVHEWGTFTVLSGPEANQVVWYSPLSDLAHLPPFVHPGIIGKGGLPDTRIRMETPVIYFYPEKPMKVSVSADFVEGSITETYPYGSLQFIGGTPSIKMRFKATWNGALHPPTDKRALSLIPEITPTNHEEPYGAAREVPDAWIFESDLKQLPGAEQPLAQPEADKFIFYRGAGDAMLPISTSLNDHQVTVHHFPAGELRHAVVLRVRGDRAGWAKIHLPDVADPSNDPGFVSAAVPELNRSLDEAEAELAADWKAALAAHGLTPAEASAMVETWRKTWFREEGDRVLTLIPRAVVDQMLPLAITPTPAKLERVFVARLEMLAPERAAVLAGVIEGGLPKSKMPAAFQPGGAAFVPDLMVPSAPPVAMGIPKIIGATPDFGVLDELKLGRFESGAMEIVIAQRAHALRQAYQQLVARRAEAMKLQAQAQQGH